jgi:hypothetical protein
MNFLPFHPGDQRLRSYARDGANAPSLGGTASHLTRCQRCRDRVAFYRSLAKFAAGLATPMPPDDLRERIIARRKAGQRVILPIAEPAVRSRASAQFFAAAALLAAIGLGSMIYVRAHSTQASSGPSNQSGGQDSLPGLRDLLGTVFLPDLASARETGTPLVRLDPIGPQIDGSRIVPRDLVYERRYSLPDGHTQRLGGKGLLRIAPALEGGQQVWKFDRQWTEYGSPPTGRDHVETESITLARSDLRMIHRNVRVTPYLRYDMINVSQQFHGDTVSGLMTTKVGDSRGVGRRFAQLLPATASPFVSDAFAPLFFTAVPMNRNWRGRLSVVGWAVRNNDVFYPLEFRVVGRENVSVPAGTFDSWHLLITENARRYDLWIRVSDGLAVRARNETLRKTLGVGEIVLVKTSPLSKSE